MQFELESLRAEGKHCDAPRSKVTFSYAAADTVEISVRSFTGMGWVQSTHVEVPVHVLLQLLMAGQTQNTRVFHADQEEYERHKKTCEECREC